MYIMSPFTTTAPREDTSNTHLHLTTLQCKHKLSCYNVKVFPSYRRSCLQSIPITSPEST